jgi:hypothetical protein
MPGWIFNLPLWIVGPVLVLATTTYALAGLRLVRRRILPRLQISDKDSEFSGSLMQAVMVFYGLAVALIAVSVWQTHADASRTVSQEATAIAALYSDVSGFREPERPILQQELRDYVRYVIDEAWPLQRRGEVPAGGVAMLGRFEAALVAFEPATEGQALLHAEALRAFNETIEAQRLRLDAVGTGLPAVMWLLIVAGAAIGLASTFFFQVEDARLHAIQVTLLAVFIALVIFMIFAFDRPFRGDLGVSPESYELIHEQLMRR